LIREVCWLRSRLRCRRLLRNAIAVGGRDLRYLIVRLCVG
jgi:hypothetical protein